MHRRIPNDQVQSGEIMELASPAVRRSSGLSARPRKARVYLVHRTRFEVPFVEDLPDVEAWRTVKQELGDTNDAQNLIEFAGRICYRSFTNAYHPTRCPQGRTQKAYIENLLRQRHMSVLEHASAGFLVITDRSVLAEITRHRHLSFSVLSQRYVSMEAMRTLWPDWVLADPALADQIQDWIDQTAALYHAIEAKATVQVAEAELSATDRRKATRQLARLVLPNATETMMVVSGNLRAWYEFLEKRCSPHADVGIREVALQILQILKDEVAPDVFGHWVLEPPAYEGDPGSAHPGQIGAP